MPCFHPVTAWKSKHANASGKRSLVFSREKGQIMSELQIPCNGCIGCRLDRARQWTSRLMHEAKSHELKSFITLTYDNEHLPDTGSLQKRDFQLFMKKFRKKHGGKIRYFMCGEYGDQDGRPHYHAIIYGCDFADKKTHSKGSQGHQLYVSATLDELWGLGHTWIGNVTHESCGYVARYCVKKVNGPQAQEHYARVNPSTGEWYLLQPEYINMSLKPGIGADWYEKFKTDIYPSDSVVVKGKQQPVPKYYDRKLEKENPSLLDELKNRRKKRALSNKADNTRERLLVRETVKLSQAKMLTRTL